ncbi:MAG: component of SufBCD complex [Rhodobacteraceae bacterium]|nr:component of SufBCD complex [Paracoccaceae bacterium]
MPYSVFDLIDLRSFSSLWYWVLVALTWARVTQAPLGVPYDMVERAGRSAAAGEDLLVMARLQVRRRRAMATRQGAVLVGLWAFVLSVLTGLTFWYGSELSFSLLLLAAPLAWVTWMTQRAARDLAATGPDVDAVRLRLRRLKRWIQAVALITVFITAVVGMYYNLVNSSF